jgi:hypothetical protein
MLYGVLHKFTDQGEGRAAPSISCGSRDLTSNLVEGFRSREVGVLSGLVQYKNCVLRLTKNSRLVSEGVRTNLNPITSSGL